MSRRTMWPNRSLLAMSLLGLLLLLGRGVEGGEPRYWGSTPYRVQIDIDLMDASFGIDATQQHRLVRGIEERIEARLRPLWNATVQVRTPGLAEAPLPASIDKRFVLSIASSGPVLSLVAHEWDNALNQWGMPQRTLSANWEATPEAAFDLIVRAFAPLATFAIEPNDPTMVHLHFRGHELRRNAHDATASQGTVLLPYLRRVDRHGAPMPDGVAQVPWTYLVVAPPSDAPQANATTGIEADVYSHTRLPFGSRRRGRIEQIALVVHHNPNQATRLRLHAQSDRSIGLSGYEVFTGLPGSTDLVRRGRTDATGSVMIPPTSGVQMAHVRCGSAVVASLPIVPGVRSLLEAPLLDERQRLEAETKLDAMREELLDLVARRQILSARIRRRIEAEDYTTAEKLLRDLEAMPGRAQFNSRLARAQQFLEADHPVVQRRLDRLFAETRSVLASSLDARQTREVASELHEARSASSRTDD